MTISVGGADPTLSLGDTQPGSGTISVPVLLDDPDPAGSTGMTEAHLALRYDPSVLSISPADITLGSIPSLGTGWQISAEVDAATGQIGINLVNPARTPITSTEAGSLVDIAFHVVPGASLSVPPVQLISQATVNGQTIVTEVDDNQGPLTLTIVAVQTFDLGVAPALNASLYENSPFQVAADQVFQEWGRNSDSPDEVVTLS